MTIAFDILLGGCILLAAHVVVLPLAKRRPVLVRGAEAYAAWSLAIATVALGHPWLAILLAVQAIVARAFRPWLVLGVRRVCLEPSARKAGALIRLPIDAPTPYRFTLSASGALHVLPLAPMVQIFAFRARRSPKIALFRNVLRKTLQNLTWGCKVANETH
jgi:hypothetical protein